MKLEDKVTKLMQRWQSRLRNLTGDKDIELKAISDLGLVPFKEIIATVCECTEVSDYTTRRRKMQYVVTRQLIVYFARKHTKMKFVEIASALGYNDHSTVIYAKQHITDLLFAHDPITTMLCDQIIVRLSENKFKRAHAGREPNEPAA